MSVIDQYSIAFRYFDPKRRALAAIAREGAVLTQSIEDEDWKVSARKKADLPLEEWLEIKRKAFLSIPAWASEIQELPSLDEVKNWIIDSVCETPTGNYVEPDGHGPDGAPSWLLALGLI